MEMYFIPRPEVETLLGAADAEILRVKAVDPAGEGITSRGYYCRDNGA